MNNKADGKAIGSLICGIIGLFIFGIIFGIIAIVLSNKSIQTNGPTGVAKAGKVLGIICIIFFFISLIMGIVGGVGMYAGLGG